jgi:molybdenum cofactor synthesis domain-containing protein
VTDATAGLPSFPLGATVPSGARVLILTISDGVANGTRQDESGMALGDRLAMAGFRVDRQTVPDERDQIQRALAAGAADHHLVISTGGTGLTPRDVTPQATLAAIDYEVPGLAEAIRASGRVRTPLADLSRGVVGVIGKSLIVNVPGSPRGALEALVALEPSLVHALETLSGPFDHSEAPSDDVLAGSSSLPPLPPLPTMSIGAPSMSNPPPSAGSTPASRSTSSGEPAPASPAPGDQNDPWRDLPRAEERGIEDRNAGAG